MFAFAYRRRTESELARLAEHLTRLEDRLAAIESEEFKLTELRRQARNAVRSLERAAANAQDAPGHTNGRRPGVEVALPPIDPPGPRRNY